ncbi:ABC transporter substrate-binding protein [Alphaproteobacteria bacterium]|nr:ABC transporter substrate-binding protein [Alphaproteobacteria bacterium]
MNCLVLLLSVGILATQTAQAEDPVQVVQSVSSTAVAKIGKGGSWSSRRAVAKKIVRSRFDAALIGRLSLGPYWKKANGDERKRYLKTFEVALAEYFLEVFSGYAGEKLQVVRSSQDSRNPKYFIVHSLLRQANGTKAKVDWKLRKAGSRFVAVDIKIKGLSLIHSYKRYYTRYLKRHNGDMEKLIKWMEAEIAKGEAKRS